VFQFLSLFLLPRSLFVVIWSPSRDRGFVWLTVWPQWRVRPVIWFGSNLFVSMKRVRLAVWVSSSCSVERYRRLLLIVLKFCWRKLPSRRRAREPVTTAVYIYWTPTFVAVADEVVSRCPRRELVRRAAVDVTWNQRRDESCLLPMLLAYAAVFC